MLRSETARPTRQFRRNARYRLLLIGQLERLLHRFADPADLDAGGQPKVVLDIMHPWSPFAVIALVARRAEEMRAKADKRLLDILTPDQQAKLDSLKGEKVEIDMSQLWGRGGRGRGR